MITVDFEKERKIFATQLFRIMEKRGIKAKELADELGVGVSTVYFWSRPIDAVVDEGWRDETNRRGSTKRAPGRS